MIKILKDYFNADFCGLSSKNPRESVCNPRISAFKGKKWGNSCANNNGFSLLELVVTVAVLSIGIVVILQAFSFSIRATGISTDLINAVFLAEDKIQELEFKERQGVINKEPTPVKDKRDKFSLEYSLDLDPDLNLYKLNFNVGWQKLNREERLDLNTYLR